MKVSCTSAARMMLVLLFALMAWGMPEARAQDDCCNSIHDLQITAASTEECCYTISGRIDIDWQCFGSWRVQEFIGGVWVNLSPSLIFNSDGTFSFTTCGQYGTHVIRVQFLGYDGKVRCSRTFDYVCEQSQDCCKYIYGPYADMYYNQDGKCCYKIYGSVGVEGLEKCFKKWELQLLQNGAWVSQGTYSFGSDGSYGTKLCVPTGTHTVRIIFYGSNGQILCIKELTLTCESNCCEYILGPYVYPSDEGECCFTIKGSVGEVGLKNCFKWWEFEYYDASTGTWVNDGMTYTFNSDGSFSIYKCFPYGTHKMRILFYGYNGELLCEKEFEHTCRPPCCETIQGPYLAEIDSPDGECCFRLWGSVGDFGVENCFKWWEFEYYDSNTGTWVNDGTQYSFGSGGTFGLIKCLPPGTYPIRIRFYGFNGELLCERELKFTCEKDCCETIHGPYIGPAPVEPHPGYCCFTITGSVGQNNKCFKYMELEILQNGVWTNTGGTWYFNPDGSFAITHCVPAGSYLIRVLFYSPNGEVICIRELKYTCEQRCCETITGPFIYPATVEPAPGRCCFTVSGTVGPQNPCFKYWEYEQLVNGVWVNDMVQYPFAADGGFSITKCVTPGTYQIRILFYDSYGNVICTKYLEYVCTSNCCETIQGPYIGPASIDPPPGRCCFTISGTIGEGNDCFIGWQYEELINGVWVNDLVTYPFNPDGSFSITKCRPYGTHYIRIFFIGPNGEVICGKKLKYTCEGDCCQTINGPFVYPAVDATDTNKCCFTVKGSIGQDNPCFRFWQYEELINGVWVNDLVNYPFNPDGSFSITKCRPFGTHTIRILFFDQDGKLICRRELTYSCESDCCESIQGPYIFPAADQSPNRCCFTVQGSVGECNPCFKFWEYEELINGVWVNDGVSYLFNADGTFSITKCRPYGTHQVRILFYGYNGELLCVRELSYTCKPVDCCETIQGPFIQTVATYPDRCCFQISGTVGPNNPCFQSFEIERYDNGVWVNDMVSYIFQPDGSFVIDKCVASGSYLFRILFRDPHGQVICIREFKYECENTCCETIQGPFIQTIFTSPQKCCFRIFGSVGPQNPCFQSYEFERFVNGVWVNDLVSYIFQPNGDFVLTKCVPPGTHLMRILFRDPNGRVICVKEFEYSCDYFDCCETIQGPFVTPMPSTTKKCCFQITGSIGEGNQCFQSVEFEVLLNGAWVNDMVSYIFQPDGSFTINKCLPPGSYTMRLLFRDFNGAIICVKEFTYSCAHNCCESIQGPFITPDPSVPNRCCFRITGNANRECFQSVEFEVLLNGVWVNDMVSYIITASGSFSIYKCLPRGTTYTMRLLFRDYSGNVICIKEFTYGCRGGLEGEGDSEAMKSSTRAVSGGLVQNLMSMPNPASDAMTISYELAQDASVRLSLFSHIGQEVLLLDQGAKTAGQQSLPVSISNLASGVYFVRLVVDGAAVDLPVTIVK